MNAVCSSCLDRAALLEQLPGLRKQIALELLRKR